MAGGDRKSISATGSGKTSVPSQSAHFSLPVPVRSITLSKSNSIFLKFLQKVPRPLKEMDAPIPTRLNSGGLQKLRRTRQRCLTFEPPPNTVCRFTVHFRSKSGGLPLFFFHTYNDEQRNSFSPGIHGKGEGDQSRRHDRRHQQCHTYCCAKGCQ